MTRRAWSTSQLGENDLHSLPSELARSTGLRTLAGLHDEPLMDPDYLDDSPGYWSADVQTILAAYFSPEHGFRRPR